MINPISNDIVMISTADWDHPFWTNKQHTAQTLVNLGYRVLYVDSLGSRKLRLKQPNDLKRIGQRLRKLFSKPREVQHNLWVGSPCLLPINFFGSRWLNRIIFSIFLKYWMRKISFQKRPWCWTYNPLSLLYVAPKNYSKLIYHCVDNIADQPGAFKSLIESEEKKLFQKADRVFTTSRALEQLAQSYNKNVDYFPNVVDFQHFNQACGEGSLPVDIQSIPMPRVGFIGAISAYKIDMDLLQEVAKRLPEVSFVLIGAVGEGDPDTEINQLSQLPNVYFLGPKRYNQLPFYLKGFDVCLIPAKITDYTKAMFPMKFFEYLAAGKPIVSTDIHAIKEFSSVYSAAKNADEFVRCIENAIASNGDEIIRERLALAKEHTYWVRTKKMLEKLGRVVSAL